MGTSGSRSAEMIILEAEDLLRTAEFGLDDMRSRPGRARSGLRNAVVFGRNSTWALQNLNSVEPGFAAWYKVKQEQMRNDPLMKFFAELRTEIEKKASTPTATHIHIKSFSAADMQRFLPAPPGAMGFFIGDSAGGTGWEVKKPDGSAERYYVELPNAIGAINLHLPTAPNELSQRPASELVTEYLAKLKLILREARQAFVK
jgi:glutaminyl-tRNA synthetase